MHPFQKLPVIALRVLNLILKSLSNFPKNILQSTVKIMEQLA